jgi:SAM-dependent methyltransferase
MEANMESASRHDAWSAGDAYDAYMGRWSRRIAPVFVDWLAPPSGLDWLDVGCGTGALSQAVLAGTDPRSLIGVDPSEAFVARATENVGDGRATFRTGDAQALDLPEASRHAVVSGLVLNFVPDKAAMLSGMRRVARPEGIVGVYVWDYPGDGLEFLAAFWSAAVELDPSAADLTEALRFPDCTPEALVALVGAAGLSDIECRPIEVETVFTDFDDFWRPFTLGAGPAPGYCAKLAPEARDRLSERLAERLPRRADGAIALVARAWAVRARP